MIVWQKHVSRRGHHKGMVTLSSERYYILETYQRDKWRLFRRDANGNLLGGQCASGTLEECKAAAEAGTGHAY